MSSIVGCFDLNNRLPKETLNNMLTAIYAVSGEKHSFQTTWGGIGGVMRPTCAQAFYECTDSSKMTMVGEFESELADTNIPRLDQMDDNAISLLRGGYIWLQMDITQQKLLIVNDHFARHPFYYFKYRDAVLFSTQIKAILAALPGQFFLDKSAVSMMLTIGEMVGNQTLVEGVVTLPAARIFSIDREGIHQRQYWRYVYQQDFSLTKQVAIQDIGEKLIQSVGRAVRKCDTAAVPLSGGLDSRFILDLARKKIKVHGYTWGVSGCRDLIFAKKTAQAVGCLHDAFEFAPNYLESYADQGIWITEGLLPVVNYHVLPYVDRLAQDGSSTLLDGFAGDGVLGGNFIKSKWLNNANSDDVANHLWHWRLNNTFKTLQNRELNSMIDVAKTMFKEVCSQYQGETSMDSVMAFLMDNRVRRVTTGGSEIFRTQFAVKQPFMDVDLVGAINSTPHEWRIRHRLYIEILKRFAPDVAAVPWQRSCLPPNVPYSVSWLSFAVQSAFKMGRKYLPLPDLMSNESPCRFDDWFKVELKDYIEGILFSERTYDRNVLPMNTLRQSWTKHLAGEVDATAFLGFAMTVELFARLFMDDLKSSIYRFA